MRKVEIFCVFLEKKKVHFQLLRKKIVYLWFFYEEDYLFLEDFDEENGLFLRFD